MEGRRGPGGNSGAAEQDLQGRKKMKRDLYVHTCYITSKESADAGGSERTNGQTFLTKNKKNIYKIIN